MPTAIGILIKEKKPINLPVQLSLGFHDRSDARLKGADNTLRVRVADAFKMPLHFKEDLTRRKYERRLFRRRGFPPESQAFARRNEQLPYGRVERVGMSVRFRGLHGVSPQSHS